MIADRLIDGRNIPTNIQLFVDIQPFYSIRYNHLNLQIDQANYLYNKCQILTCKYVDVKKIFNCNYAVIVKYNIFFMFIGSSRFKFKACLFYVTNCNFLAEFYQTLNNYSLACSYHRSAAFFRSAFVINVAKMKSYKNRYYQFHQGLYTRFFMNLFNYAKTAFVYLLFYSYHANL